MRTEVHVFCACHVIPVSNINHCSITGDVCETITEPVYDESYHKSSPALIDLELVGIERPVVVVNFVINTDETSDHQPAGTVDVVFYRTSDQRQRTMPIDINNLIKYGKECNLFRYYHEATVYDQKTDKQYDGIIRDQYRITYPGHVVYPIDTLNRFQESEFIKGISTVILEKYIATL